MHQSIKLEIIGQKMRTYSIEIQNWISNIVNKVGTNVLVAIDAGSSQI
jgi:hypothetical protein